MVDRAAGTTVEGRRRGGLGWCTERGTTWRRILGSVHSYADLAPALLGRVEELIDFVTTASSTP